MRQAFILLFILALSACEGSGGDASGERSSTENSCSLNSDCQADQRCEEGVCLAAPQSIDQGTRCDDRGCLCRTNGDCVANEICDPLLGICAPLECLQEMDCSLGSRCERGRCVIDVEADRDSDGVPDGTRETPR